MTHWATLYIGDPWVAGEHDCWAFARRVWREQFGWHVPAVDVDALNQHAISRAITQHPERSHWQRLDDPQEGAGVLMGKSDRAAHVGIWTEADGGGVVHCVEGIGVVFNTLSSLQQSGWRVLGWYRRVG
jgi:cell wall-associated NlpC family hydrolase